MNSEAGLMMLAYGGKQKFRGQKTVCKLKGERAQGWGRALTGLFFFLNVCLSELALK